MVVDCAQFPGEILLIARSFPLALEPDAYLEGVQEPAPAIEIG